MSVQIYSLAPEITEKLCSACREVLPVSEFYELPGTKDGYRHLCRECSRRQKRENYAAGKICFTCGEKKPRSEFYRREKSKDGLVGSCKPCSIAKNSKYKRKRGYKKPKFSYPLPPVCRLLSALPASPGRLEHYRGLSLGVVEA